MRELLRELGVETWRDALATAGTILALFAILAGMYAGMVTVAVLAGVQ